MTAADDREVTPAPDLHAALEAAITTRLEVARAATPGPWTASPYVYGKPEDGYGPPTDWEVESPMRTVVSHQPHEGGGANEVDARHIALHDPADAVRRYERDLKVLKRHSPASDEPDPCAWCYSAEDISHYLPHPCLERTDLLDVYPEVTK